MPSQDSDGFELGDDDNVIELGDNWTTILRAFNNVFVGNPNGEVVLRYLKNAFLERTSLNEEGNYYKTVASEGKRFVVLDILRIIEEGMM